MSNASAAVLNKTVVPSQAENVLASCGILVLSLVGLFPYSLLIFILVRYRSKFHNAFYTLALSLAISDSSMLCIYIIYSVPSTIFQIWPLGKTFDKAAGVLVNLTYYSSMPALVSIAINRYFAICNFESYKIIYSKKMVAINIVVIWLFGSLCASFQAFPCCHLRYYYDLYFWSYDIELWGFPYYAAFEQGVLVVTVLSGIIAYSLIACYQIKQKQYVKDKNLTEQQAKTIKRQQSEVRLEFQFVIVVLYGLVFAIVFTNLPNYSDYRWHLYISTVMYIVNCSINPYVYFSMSKSLRTEVLKLFGLKVKSSMPQQRQPKREISRGGGTTWGRDQNNGNAVSAAAN